MKIREFNERLDLTGLKRCFVELQDAERLLDARMPGGTDIVAAYIPTMLDRCLHSVGKVFVAEADANIIGFVTVLTRVSSDDVDDGDLEYGLVSDLLVTTAFRRRGIGRNLLSAAETYAREQGVRWLRVGVLSANNVAKDLYRSSGFSDLYVELEKDLSSKAKQEDNWRS